MYLGLADHLGWAVAVASDHEHRVVDRRRIELVEPGVTPAPIHYDAPRLEPSAVAALVAEVRASVLRASTAAIGELVDGLPGPLRSLSLQTIPESFPTDLATLLRPPWEARADAVMYREILVDVAGAIGVEVRFYEARTVEAEATAILGERADEVLRGPRSRLGPPWAKDHRTALAANVVAAGR